MLQKILLNNSQRATVGQVNNLQDFVSGTLNVLFKDLITEDPVILKGFRLYNNTVGTTVPTIDSACYLELFDSMCLHTDMAAGSYLFLGTSADARYKLTLTRNAVNYIEIDLDTQGETPTLGTFWQQSSKQEFTQTVNSNERVVVSASTVYVVAGAFTVGRLPLFKVTVDVAGNITTIEDCRNMMFRLADNELGSAYDAQWMYPWTQGVTDESNDIRTGGVSYSNRYKNL